MMKENEPVIMSKPKPITDTMKSQKGRILFVEDERDMITIYNDFLWKQGYDFLSTSDIREALDITRFELPDLVLLDIIIPKPEDTTAEQGWEYLEKAKSDPEIQHIPVVVFTNLDTSEAREKSEKLGAAAFIFKRDTTPVEVEEVMADIIQERKNTKKAP